MKAERNEICRCGSGRKYKKCCLFSEHEKGVEIIPIETLSEVQEECDRTLAKIEAGDLASAKIEADLLHRLFPNDPTVNYLQGICLIKEECYPEAISFFEKAIQMDSHFSEALFNLALLYRQDLKIVKSVGCFKKTIEIEGEQGDLGKLAKKELDRFEEMTQKTTGQTLDQYVLGMALFDRAFACLKEESYEEAIELFQQVLAVDPNHVQSYGNMALAYSALGNKNMALKHLDKALSIDPTYEPARLNRIIVSQSKEGEKRNLNMKEIFYYQEKLESNGLKKQKSRTFSLASIFGK